MDTPQEFFRSACKINLTFNWMYINRRHIAYFNSGANPVRSPLTDPNFPAFASRRYRWRDYETRGSIPRTRPPATSTLTSPTRAT